MIYQADDMRSVFPSVVLDMTPSFANILISQVMEKKLCESYWYVICKLTRSLFSFIL